MKRRNLIATKKVKKNKLLFKNPKILNFYKKFKSTIFKYIQNKSSGYEVSRGFEKINCLGQSMFTFLLSSDF